MARLIASLCLLLAFGMCRAEESRVKSETTGYWVAKSETSDAWRFLYFGPDGRGAAAFFDDDENGSEFCFQNAAETNGVMTAALTGSHFPRASIAFGAFQSDQGSTGLLTGAIFLFMGQGSEEKLFNSIFLTMHPVADATQIPDRAKQWMTKCGIDYKAGK